MDSTSKTVHKTADDFQHDPNHIALSRMLIRYQNLILLRPTLDEALDSRLAPLQQKTQTELWSPLPYHRTKWLRNIEGARNLLLKLEQNALGIKVQRAKREFIKDLGQKRVIIKQLRNRVEEIGREVDSNSRSNHYKLGGNRGDDGEETMLDVLQQIRRDQAHKQKQENESQIAEVEERPATHLHENSLAKREELFASDSTMHRRQVKSNTGSTIANTSEKQQNEQALLNASSEQENITVSLLNMAAQLKQQVRQFQFTLEQDPDIIGRAMEGLDKNMTAMGFASKGMKTLQRMSEEQGFWGRLKLQLLIGGMWLIAIILVFAGPKLRF